MYWEFILRLLVAGALGTVIGIEREYRAKEAGFRTHFMVSFGSALFMLISQYGFEEFTSQTGVTVDPSRIAAQIVSGIGFIGAGTIIFQRQFVRGLTTAAGLWATAGIGMAIGGGMYVLGIAATVLTLAGLELLTIVFKGIGLTNMAISYSTSNRENLTKIIDKILSKKCRIINYSTLEEKDKEITIYKVSMSIKIHNKQEENELFGFIQSLPDLVLTAME